MERLPTRGEKPYYDILVPWLRVAHNADGTLAAGQTVGSIVIGTAVGGTIALNALSGSTSAPAVVGQATGYYAALFFNITDQGSDLANARAIGLVAQSIYSNAGYFQQGGAPGSPGETLGRNSTYPALYVTRVAGSLGGFDFTAPIFRIDETTLANGGLMDVKKQGGTVVFAIDKNGSVTIAPSTGVGLTIGSGRGVQFTGNGTTPGPSINASSNTLRIIGGTSGILFGSQDNGTQWAAFSNTGVLTLNSYGGGGGQVTVGAADSGGAGFKVLRVPN